MTLVDSIMVALGINAKPLTDGLKKAEQDTKQSASTIGKSVDDMSSKASSKVKLFARSLVAPVASLLTVSSMFKSYFSGVAEVARMTGAYSTKLEEWRKKRALLQRVTREDIELYKKNREALTKFQISMADLSALIMRKAAPAIQFVTNMLNKFSDWVGANQDNIVRFLTVTAGVLTTLLIPAVKKFTDALLLNPAVRVAVALAALILVIDDLVTWLQDGESEFGEFYQAIADLGKLEIVQEALQGLKDILDSVWQGLKALGQAAVDAWDDFVALGGVDELAQSFNDLWGVLKDIASVIYDNLIGAFKLAWQGLKDLLALFDIDPISLFKFAVLATLQTISKAFKVAVNLIKSVWGALVGLFTGDFSMLQDASDAIIGEFANAWAELVKLIGDKWDTLTSDIKSIWTSITSSVKDLWTALKGLFTGDFSAIGHLWDNMCDGFDNAWKDLCASIKALWNDTIGFIADVADTFLPDWAMDKIGLKDSTTRGRAAASATASAFTPEEARRLAEEGRKRREAASATTTANNLANYRSWEQAGKTTTNSVVQNDNRHIEITTNDPNVVETANDSKPAFAYNTWSGVNQ